MEVRPQVDAAALLELPAAVDLHAHGLDAAASSPSASSGLSTASRRTPPNCPPPGPSGPSCPNYPPVGFPLRAHGDLGAARTAAAKPWCIAVRSPTAAHMSQHLFGARCYTAGEINDPQ